MTGILISFNLGSIILLLWSFIQGYQAGATLPVRSHIVMALIATAFSVFSHCMTMMYFVAVGRVIRETVEKANLDGKYVVETKMYRKKVFRIALIAMVLVMTHTILGGGAHTRAFPVWIHETLAIIMLLVSSYAAYIEIRYLISNHLLGHHVAQLYEERLEPQRIRSARRKN